MIKYVQEVKFGQGIKDEYMNDVMCWGLMCEDYVVVIYINGM